MALVNCKECGTKISDKALACPKCGATQNDNSEKQGLNKSVENVFISSETKTFEIENQTSKTKEQIGETPNSKKPNSRFKWTLLGIMTVILIGGIILLVRKSPEELFEIAENYKIQGNIEDAAEYYQLAAEKGHAKAQFNLATCYISGEGVEQNFYEAAKWYKLAAEQGIAGSQCMIGLMYLRGKEVPLNYNEAAKWLRLAAEQGIPEAQIQLGRMYSQGMGVEQNFYEAAKWAKLAAEQGFALAQTMLGMFYENGIGVEKNYNEAIRWLRLAAEQGESSAIMELNRLELQEWHHNKVMQYGHSIWKEYMRMN